jgi:hypothetical protein
MVAPDVASRFRQAVEDNEGNRLERVLPGAVASLQRARRAGCTDQQILDRLLDHTRQRYRGTPWLQSALRQVEFWIRFVMDTVPP